MASRTRRNAEENEEYMTNILATVEFQEFMEEMNEASEHALFWSKATMQRRLRLLDKFITFHRKSPKLAPYADKIFSVDTLTERCCSYLTVHVQVSQASVRKGPVAADGSVERMSWPSLRTVRDDLLALIINFCPDATRELVDEWTERLNSHCQHLVETYSMVKTQRPKQYWGPPELRLLIEQCFKDIVRPTSRRSLDMILQHFFLWTLLLMTGCRPGSLLSNRVYPNEYVRYKHLSLRRTPVRGQFDLLINIVSWKGGHTNRPYSCTFTIRAVMVEHMLELDAATQLIAIGLRRQAFRDHVTLDSLLDGTDYIIKWRDELLDESVFQASIPGGGGLAPGSILTYNGARLFMKAMAADSTLGGTFENAVLYGFRRAAASVLQLCFGSDTAKGILHHRAKSDTLNEAYSNVHQTANTSGAILEGKTSYSTQTTLQNAPALHRSTRTEPIKPLSLAEAVSGNHHLKDLFMQRAFLGEHLKTGSTAWTAILPAMDESFVEKHGLLPELQLARKAASLVDDNGEDDEKDDGNNQEPDLEDFRDGENLDKCAELYKAVTRSYKQLLAWVRKSHIEDTRTRVDAESRDNLSLQVYEERRENLTKRIKLPPIFCQLLREESVREEELEKRRILGENEAPQGEFDEELGMECARLQGQPTDQLMVKRVALLRVWTSYVDGEMGRQQCLLCLREDDLPDSLRERFYKSRAVLLEHQKHNHPESGAASLHSSNATARRRQREELVTDEEDSTLPASASPMAHFYHGRRRLLTA